MAARLTDQERAYRTVKEYDLMKQAIDLALFTNKWLCNHQRPGMTKTGDYRTPIMGNAGFPDVVFASDHYGLIIFAEFKRELTKRSPEQDEWAKQLEALAGSTFGDIVHYRLWRPSSWPEIQQVLTEGTFPA